MKQELDIIERLTRIEEIGKSTLLQTERTNGRVTILEGKVDSLESTRDKQEGAMGRHLKLGGLAAVIASGVAMAIAGIIKKLTGFSIFQ